MNRGRVIGGRVEYRISGEYSSKIQILDSTQSQLLAHYSAYYLTPNIGQKVVLFRIAKRGRAIRQSLVDKIVQRSLCFRESIVS